MRKFFSQKIFALSFITAMAMVAVEVSLGFAIFSIVMLVWKWGVENRNWRKLPKKATGALSVVFLAIVLVQFRTLAGQDSAYTFLLALSALRVMDYENERDHKFVTLLGFLLVAAKSLFSLDIYWIVPTFVAFTGLWYSLLPKNLQNRGRLLLKIFALSFPFAVVMFFVFPRVVVPWAISRGPQGGGGEVGFSEELNPGQVAELAQNPAVAFRAKILDSDLIKEMNQYWRGSVLTKSKGLTWRVNRTGLGTKEKALPVVNPAYQVAIEPNSQVYLFALYGTQTIELEDNSVIPLPQHVFRSVFPISKASVYRADWKRDWFDLQKPDDEALQTPQLTGKVQKWVDAVLKRKLSEADKLLELKSLFANGEFIYTLKPGRYDANDLEVFLFIKKKGFCEHFAGAYATLARALGIPSRVIVGYQGGRYNPLGNFWKISQKDAHAWVEIYTEGRWQREDPTSWVAPLRMVLGGEEFFSLSEADQEAFARNVHWRPSEFDSILFWNELTLWFEDLNYRWNYFLMDFDRASQKSFLDKISHDHKYIKGLMVLLVSVLVLGAYFKNLRRRASFSEEQLLLREFEMWAAKQGVPRHLSEPPLSYLERLKRAYPQHQDVLEMAARFYDRSAYGKLKPDQSRNEILKIWKKRAQT